MHRQHRYMHSHRKVDQSSSLGRTDVQLRLQLYRVKSIELDIASVSHLGKA